MRSLWLLNELGIDFELVVHPFTELRSEQYLKVHPLGRVPALQLDELTLFESGAICQYLCEKFSLNTLGRDTNHPERPQWLQWLHFSETMAVHGASLVQQNIVLQDKSLRSPVIEKLETRRLEKSLEVINDQLTDHDYLLASGFSAVDIAVGYSIHLAQHFIDLSDYHNVELYYQRLSQRDAFKQSMPSADDNLKIF